MTRCGQRSVAVSGPIMWNSLPPTVRDPLLTWLGLMHSWRPCYPAQL